MHILLLLLAMSGLDLLRQCLGPSVPATATNNNRVGGRELLANLLRPPIPTGRGPDLKKRKPREDEPSASKRATKPFNFEDLNPDQKTYRSRTPSQQNLYQINRVNKRLRKQVQNSKSAIRQFMDNERNTLQHASIVSITNSQKLLLASNAPELTGMK